MKGHRVTGQNVTLIKDVGGERRNKEDAYDMTDEELSCEVNKI